MLANSTTMEWKHNRIENQSRMKTNMMKRRMRKNKKIKMNKRVKSFSILVEIADLMILNYPHTVSTKSFQRTCKLKMS